MQVRIEAISMRFANVSWALRNNPKVWEFMEPDTPMPATQKGDAGYYHDVRCKMSQPNANVQMFAILADEEFVGCCKLKNIANGAAELSYYILDTNAWGKGICTDATTRLIDYGFERLGLDMIYRYVNVNNVGSMRVAEKQKFAKVGISFINPEVVRLEMTKTGWLRQKKHKRKVMK